MITNFDTENNLKVKFKLKILLYLQNINLYLKKKNFLQEKDIKQVEINN